MVIYCNIERVSVDEIEVTTSENPENNGLEVDLKEKLSEGSVIEDIFSVFDCDLDKITVLKLTNCGLNCVPDCFATLRLRELDLSFNKLKTLPNCLNLGLSELLVLNVSNNFIEIIDFDPKCCKVLQCLNLRKNNLKQIPRWLTFENCQNLKNVDLGYNSIGPFLSAYNFQKLTKLKLNNTKMKNLNPIYSIRELEYLNVGNKCDEYVNLMATIDFSKFRSQTTLIELNLSGLGLSSLTEDLNLLKNLQVLDISRNHIYDLPKIDLPKLKTLDLSHNNFMEVDNLPASLLELYLSYNVVSSLGTLTSLTNLRILDAYSNYIAEAPDIESLCAVDLEQNYVDTTPLEGYLEKKTLLRKNLSGRFDGEKVLSKESDSFSSSSRSYEESDCGAVVVGGGFGEEENWDNYDTDDDLYIEPYELIRVPRRKKTYFYNDMLFDESCFEDALEDS